MRSAWMMRIAVSGWVLIGPVAFALQPEEARPSPGAGIRIPRPPRQDGPWTPPSSGLPGPLVEAARVLFEQGFADPRGCAYREVELAVEPDPYGRKPPTTHAWVIPFDVTGGPRYAVAWNGLVYPVARLGQAVDLEDDARALAERPSRVGAWWYRFTHDPVWRGRNLSDLETASPGDLAPIKAVILLRLGRADLAELVWKAGPGRQAAANPPGRQADAPDLYANLAVDWEWALFRRAASAHEAGNDPVALATLRELARIKPRVEGRIGAPDPRPGAVFRDFLAQFPRFLADQERRAREPGRAPALGRTFPDREARIAALIRDLDQVRGPRLVSGRFETRNPIVGAIIEEGDAAVGPLLDCLEHDDRLSRMVNTTWGVGGGLSTGPFRFIQIRGADSAAYEALLSILGTHEFGRHASRAELAAAIRAHWQRTRGGSREEGLFRTLADDAADAAEWSRAAEALVRPGDDQDQDSRPRGEPLRSRTKPSITDLMARRCRQLDVVDGPPGASFDVRGANRMAIFLAAWDPKGALPTLERRVAHCAGILKDQDAGASGYEDLAADIARLTMLRARGGDAAALDEYAAWARTVRPPGYGSFSTALFEPLWAFPDHPAIVAATKALFDDPASPWVPLMGPETPGWGPTRSRSDIIVSPMLGVPLFRGRVLDGLADDRPSGSARYDADGKATIVLDRYLSQAPTLHPDDPHRPRPGTSMPLRVRDKYAWKLAQIRGFPRFELYWPRELRDRTIAEDVALLSRYGDRLGTVAPRRLARNAPTSRPEFPRAVLVFPPLGQPATPGDVAAGRAIFAARPAADARTYPLAARPMMGLWTKLEIPLDETSLRPYDGRPEQASMIRSLRWGVVWQAEEIREGDRWRRYYGFVGHHVIARVPAEEVDFPGFPPPHGYRWRTISHDLDGLLVPPVGRDDGRMIPPDPVSMGGPLPVAVRLRNHRGIDAAVPIDLARPGGILALREGLSIRLWRHLDPREPDPVAGLSRVAPPETAPRSEIAPRCEPARYRSGAVRNLKPAEVAELLRLDLRDLFDLAHPGSYLVEVELPGLRDEQGNPARVSSDFKLK